MTRMLDILISLLAVLLLLPFLPIVAFFIKIDSRGPVFYTCKRVGQGGKIFKMYKFRTMHEHPGLRGPSVSPQGDPRVTRVGRVLRRLKLNEVPQFFNVLQGDMTLVGPRPEAPDLAQRYPEAGRRIFSVKPGLVGPNQILGRNEEELYPPGVDPTKFYLEEILPKKMAVDLAYIEDKSFFKDLRYLFLGLKVTVTGTLSRRHLLDNRGQLVLLLCDTALCLLSLSLSHYLRYDWSPNRGAQMAFLKLLPWAVGLRIPVFIFFGFYHSLIRHFSYFDAKRIFQGVALTSLALAGVSSLSSGISGQSHEVYARSVFFIDWSCLTFVLIGYRGILKKWYQRRGGNDTHQSRKRVVIWGAGDAGELCIQYLRKSQYPLYEVVGFIDDDRTKKGKRLLGAKILGDRHHLPILTLLYNIQQIFVAIHSATTSELNAILEICHHQDLPACLFQFAVTPCLKITQGKKHFAFPAVRQLSGKLRGSTVS
ncbi:MAG: hypothetical protein A2Y80_07895 [Deltaproteobacteria bacterium RBG_13_58_19]|nr:MAG: hypothetical protein A2Y80_07895 [Deltaproteobacteria bacterium RBG_13_58_19]